MRDRVQLDPDYQRQSDIWTLDKRQLLLDTVLNGFDVPKIYLQKFQEPKKSGSQIVDYAIIDGKQRLESLWSFLDGSIALSDDFKYFNDASIQAAGMKYNELGKAYPDLKNQFDSYPIAVIVIETDDLEMIEEMFSRLNEAVPLTAAEKRNAFGGPLPIAIKKLAGEPFFSNQLPFTNLRYRHFDLAAKFLLAEHVGKVPDTKKEYLDAFVKSFKGKPRMQMPTFLKPAQETVKLMASVFTSSDALLRQVGMVAVYYHLFRVARNEDWTSQITRKKLLAFDQLRADNRKVAETDLTKAEYNLIEFDRYTQSPNDAGAVKFRLRVMMETAFNKKVQTDAL
jgi:hypothetical protein